MLSFCLLFALTGCRNSSSDKDTSSETKDASAVRTESETENHTEKVVSVKTTENTQEEILTESVTDVPRENGSETEETLIIHILESEDGERTDGMIADEVVIPLEEEALIGASWSLGFEDLSTGESYGFEEKKQLQSASVIKVFIMGAVCEEILYPSEETGHAAYTSVSQEEIRSLLNSMITVSDNNAANRLVEILGNGNFDEGAAMVNAFCMTHGYPSTILGRRFLGSNENGDNYTSAEDCRKFLEEVYKGELVSREASEEMLSLLKQQTRKNKIPSGLSEGCSSANKTGEMSEGYGLGCIENDIAIVFTPVGDYILTILSNDLGGRNGEAISLISELSGLILQNYIGTYESASEQ